jgi:rhodanese-related sulfurtransferase
MKTLFRGVLIIIVLSVILGTAVNFPLLRRFAAGEFKQGFVDRREYAGIRFISLAEAEDLFARKMQGTEGLLFIDSRRGEDFAAGHIPGAVSLPPETIRGSGKGDHGQGSEGSLDFPGIQTLVVYCEGGDCLTSQSLAMIMHDRGYADIRILAGGWSEWKEAGLPEEKGP